jgi:hypothetical protein
MFDGVILLRRVPMDTFDQQISDDIEGVQGAGGSAEDVRRKPLSPDGCLSGPPSALLSRLVGR